jgi:pimeloyl-ACP methyl ester carboxylesterase
MGPAERMVDLGTHSLHAVILGDGAPAIVIDGGIGATADEYRTLQERLAEETTVVAYDRAGYGQSEAGPLPRDSGTEAEELRALLDKLGLSGPYLLVGHSLGGLNVEVYASLYAEEVGGMVLLDPPPLAWLLGERYPGLRTMAEQMTAEWQGIADRGADLPDGPQRSQALFFQMLASEHREMLGSSARLAAGIESFGDTPLQVVASGVPNERFGADAEGYQQYWVEESRVLAAKSNQGRFVLAEDSTHRLHDDAFDVVVQCIVAVLDDLRKQR